MAGFLDNKKRITLASFLAYFVMSGMLAPIGIISGPMSALFGQSITDVTAQFGWLTFGNLAGAALALIIFTFFRVRTVLGGAYLLIVACLLLLNFADSLTTIGISLGVVGVCSGLGLASAALVISRIYEAEQRASMLVITDACFSTAGFLCAAIATALVAAGLHWTGIYQFVALIAAIIVVLSLVSSFPDGQAARTVTGPRESWPVSYWLCVAALFLYTLGQYSMLWWLPNYAETRLGATVEQAGRLVTLFWMGLFVAQLFVAWWVLKLGVRKLVLISAVLTCLFSIPLWLSGSLSMLPVFAFLWGFANLSLLKVVLSYATQMVKLPTPRLVSTLLLGATLGTAVSPWVTSRIVVLTDNYLVLQFSSICYAALATLLFIAVRRAHANA
ncbi:MAG: MFS transporter TsgA [Proteobacteria bacterium]|nr:MFS transporter TsgA [Pseudomonadota bacterium]